jgi:hypothetical protein
MGNRHRHSDDLPAGLLDSLVASASVPAPLRRRELARVRTRLATLDLKDIALLEDIAASVLVESVR